MKIQDLADGVFQAFEAVNTLLNELAEGRVSDGESALRRRIAGAGRT